MVPEPSVPTAAAELTPGWLSAALASSFPGISVRGVRCTRIGEGYGLASEVYRVGLDGVSGPRSVVVKLWDTTFAGEGEGHALELLATAAVRCVPRAFAHAVDSHTKRGVLVLEDVHPATQCDCLERMDRAAAIALATRLADIHAVFHDDATLASDERIPDATRSGRDEDWITSRGARFRERYPELRDGPWRALFDRAGALVTGSDAVLNAATPTLIHKDVHLDNVLVDAEGELWLLDWARAARGPGVVDLVEVLIHVAPPADRERVADAYLTRLADAGISPRRERFDRELAAAFARAFLTGTYGVSGWEPTEARARSILAVHLQRLEDAVPWFTARPGWNDVRVV